MLQNCDVQNVCVSMCVCVGGSRERGHKKTNRAVSSGYPGPRSRHSSHFMLFLNVKKEAHRKGTSGALSSFH